MRIRQIVASGAVLLAAGAAAGCGLVGGEKATDKAGITENITHVEFTNDSGNLTIKRGDAPSVERHIEYRGDKPGATHRVEDGVLIIDSCPQRHCSIDYDIVVPEGVEVAGKLDSGSAEIRGVAEVNLEVDSGRVDIADVTGKVNVDADSGNVDLSHIGGTAQVVADSGDVTVDLAEAADVRVDANSGNVDVRVPDAAYRVTAVANSGEVTNEVQDDADADQQIDVRADSGDIRIGVI